MGDFNQDAFQRLMMMPGGAAGFGMSGAGRDQAFQDYMNKKMQEDAHTWHKFFLVCVFLFCYHGKVFIFEVGSLNI